MIRPVRAILAAVLACGCGKIDFDPLIDARALDAAPDVAAGPALCNLPFGQWVLTPPAPLDNVNALLVAQFPANGDQDEYDSVFSDDGLSLYFTSDQSGAFQVWTATRPSLTAPFDTVALLGPDVNAATNSVFGFQPLASLDIAIVAAPYTGSMAGGLDFWLGTHMTGSWVWSPTDLSTPDGDIDARMTADGLAVYLARGATVEEREIYTASRNTIAGDFGSVSLVPEVNSAVSDSSPVPVSDGIFVVTDRPGGAGMDDIWYAARSSTGFDPPYPLAAVNGPAVDGEPAMYDRNGSCELIFSTTRDASGAWNLYRSYVMPM